METLHDASSEKIVASSERRSVSQLDRVCPGEQCEDARCQNPTARIWYCADCDSNYCSRCWQSQGPHKLGKVGRNGRPHEKMDVAVVIRLKRIFQLSRSSDELRRAIELDQSNRWLGVSCGLDGGLDLEDYGAFATLMAKLTKGQKARRYPRLVSFPGQRSIGKSIIIKLLINHAPDGCTADLRFPEPVAGLAEDFENLITSPGVSLYADRASNATDCPMYYAKHDSLRENDPSARNSRSSRRRKLDPIGRWFPPAERDLYPVKWPEVDSLRGYTSVATRLFSRLLYTFSDVAVFVYKASTSPSSILHEILDWAVCAIDSAINQPSHPHVIIILDESGNGTDEREWDSRFATQSFLTTLRNDLDDIGGATQYEKPLQDWMRTGRSETALKDLLDAHFSSFQVVRVPVKPRYMHIHRQISRLHAVIQEKCEQSHGTRSKARMEADAETLNLYLRAAVSHFTATETTPLDFAELERMTGTAKYDFGGHIMQLARTITTIEPVKRFDSAFSQWTFDTMRIMIASCAILENARSGRLCQNDLFESNRDSIRTAIHEYFDMSQECAHASTDGRHCKLMKARHGLKFHQDYQGIIGIGAYECNPPLKDFISQWETRFKSTLQQMQSEFLIQQELALQKDASMTGSRIAFNFHLQNLQTFYGAIEGSGRIVSHSSCFCCLMNAAEHLCPCGHVLCTACIRACAEHSTNSTANLLSCPLHPQATKWNVPHRVRFKDKDAGTRVLSLDSGGVRGIVQIEMLRALEHALHGTPIQYFFDLIVGTGTGGVIALALGHEQWSINRCISEFASLCHSVFSPSARRFSLLDSPITTEPSRRLRTKYLHEALRRTFGESNRLFGNQSANSNSSIKVALSSSNSTESDTILLTNYRRQHDDQASHGIEQPCPPDSELRVWEAAAACTSAPAFFLPFLNPRTNHIFQEGLTRESNLARTADQERKLLWPDSSQSDPDLLLSLGTGQDRLSVLSATHREVSGESNKRFSRALSMRSAQQSGAEDIFQAETSWAGFRDEVVKADAAYNNSRRYIRFNPDLGRNVPAFDAKDDLASLQVAVRKRLSHPNCITAIQHVASRLVATSFFVKVRGHKFDEHGCSILTCSMHCKFDKGTVGLCGVGKYLRRATRPTFRPYFSLKSRANSDQGIPLDIPPELISCMAEQADFFFPDFAFRVEDLTALSETTLVLFPHDGLEPGGFPVSNFPRRFCQDQALEGISFPRRSPTASAEDTLQAYNSHQHVKTPGDDTISINGIKTKGWMPLAGPLARLRHESRLATTTNPRPNSFSDMAKSYTALKGPNRFWATIGPQHMLRHRYLYSDAIIQKFVPGAVLSPVELDGGEETEVRHNGYAELDGTGVPRPQSADNALPGDFDQSATAGSRTSALTIRGSITVTEAILDDYLAKTPPTPAFTSPPSLPPKAHLQRMRTSDLYHAF